MQQLYFLICAMISCLIFAAICLQFIKHITTTKDVITIRDWAMGIFFFVVTAGCIGFIGHSPTFLLLVSLF